MFIPVRNGLAVSFVQRGNFSNAPALFVFFLLVKGSREQPEGDQGSWRAVWQKKKKLGYEMRDLLCFPGLAVFVL